LIRNFNDRQYERHLTLALTHQIAPRARIQNGDTKPSTGTTELEMESTAATSLMKRIVRDTILRQHLATIICSQSLSATFKYPTPPTLYPAALDFNVNYNLCAQSATPHCILKPPCTYLLSGVRMKEGKRVEATTAITLNGALLQE
jgi:hypothetical protein